jgi:putative ABC transport system permease protein
MFRREWRQQVVVLVLLSLTVAAAVFAAIAAYNITTPSSAKVGNADHRITLASADSALLTSVVADLATKYAPAESIWHAQLPVPGSVDTVDLRAEDPNGALSSPLLALDKGRYPTALGEVALTNGVAATFSLQVDDQLSILSDSWTVVGVVENPTDLGDEFILTIPGDPRASESVNLLVRGHDELHQRANSIRSFQTKEGVSAFSESRGTPDRGPAVIGALALDTVALLLVSLVAAAAFVVVAQRRLRQFGMLAAMGATGRQLRLVTIAHGLIAGAVAAFVGGGIGLVAWVAFSPWLESPVGHRIDSGAIPWLVLVAGMMLAVATTTAASWWPARTTARVPVVIALSGRPPRPKRAHRSALVALAFLAIGFVLLAMGIDKQGRAKAWGVIGGPIAIVLGILFICPIAIRVLAASANRFPIAARLAVRDLARYQARAAAALAAISLGLGIAFTAIIVSTAATPKASAGNLSDRQLLVRLGDNQVVPVQTPAQLAQLEATIATFAGTLDGAVVYPLDVAAPSPEVVAASGGPALLDPLGRPGQQIIGLGHREPHGISISGDETLYIATPELLSRIGVDSSAVNPSTEMITPATGDLILADLSPKQIDPAQLPAPVIQTIHDPGYSDQPKSFITESALRSHGWVRVRAGWLIETDHAITSQQRADARDLAAHSGLTVVARNQQRGLYITRLVATAAGMLLALGILAMTIGLIRGEASRDLQTLTATGATSTTRRMLTAATAAALALLGAILGLAGAYVGLLGGYQDKLSPLVPIPITYLAVVVLGLPIVAGAVAWLVGGREPAALTRRALD